MTATPVPPVMLQWLTLGAPPPAAAPGMNPWAVALTVFYLALLGLIAMYGVHRYWLVHLFRKHRRDLPRAARRFTPEEMPRITVQLPMYNEAAVTHRIIDAACRLEYPRARFQVQVLDDSTDGSHALAADRVVYWRAQGIDIELVHRTDRTGYKAGALDEAMATATGELIAIFDADFIPPPTFLKRTVHHFSDPGIGMVQTRWSHLNREDSLLTRAQAIFLDGHFVVEHTARNRGDAWINFNGTAGLWRRTAIEAAGGWQHDTLTEDVDLSYRAQLAGWRFRFLPRVTCPAELPPEMNAFKSQQHRWTKGSIQTAIKLLPTVFRSPAPLKVKVEAFFHLTSPMVYLYITLFALLFYPAIAINLTPMGHGSWGGVLFGVTLFALGTVSASTFYLISQRAQHRSTWHTLLQIPLLMAVGVGIALSNAVAVLEALLGHESAFIRTPKYGDRTVSASNPPSSEPSPATTPVTVGMTKYKRRGGIARVIPVPDLRKSITVLEVLMGVYMLVCAELSLHHDATIVSLPFLLLFAAGYFYVGFTSGWTHLRSWWESRRPEPQPA